MREEIFIERPALVGGVLKGRSGRPIDNLAPNLSVFRNGSPLQASSGRCKSGVA
jgi:hypothetical protein